MSVHSGGKDLPSSILDKPILGSQEKGRKRICLGLDMQFFFFLQKGEGSILDRKERSRDYL